MERKWAGVLADVDRYLDRGLSVEHGPRFLQEEWKATLARLEPKLLLHDQLQGRAK